MRPPYKLIAILAILGATLPAIGREAFDDISWNPRPIKVGAPCLFKVELSATPSSVKAKWQGRDLVFFPAGSRHVWYGLAGVDVEATPGTDRLELEATMPDGQVVRAVREIQVQPSTYKTERLKVPERFVQPDAETLKRIEADKEAKREAFSHQIPTPEWSGNFRAPVNSSASEGFGTRRTFNGKLASIHRGLDYHAPEGTPIRAANGGTVVLAQELFYEGNCVILDHGEQFMTLYMHLSKIQVAPGETVKQGQQIGLSGATGRATGPHLHVAVRWQGAYLDPAQLWLLPLPRLDGPDVR
ncbi:MAG TPA: M23 family metallopeptidase [Terriglobales bacterium]|nr:M23 family metallopeptidase [Terriglobales bacterium]